MKYDWTKPQDWTESTAWQEVARSHGLAETLDALLWLHVRIRTPESPDYRRLRVLVPGLRGPTRRAAERILLDVRRACAAGEHRTRFDVETDDALDIELGPLQDGDLEDRVSWIHQVTTEERFDLARAVAERLPREEEPMVAAALAYCLGVLGGASTLAVLKDASRHEHRDVRLGAVLGIENRCGRPAMRLLLERLMDEDEQVRRQADQALASYPPHFMVRLLKDIPAERGAKFHKVGREWLEKWGYTE